MAPVLPPIPSDGGGSISTTSVEVLSEVPPGQQRIVYSITNVSTGGQNLTIAFGRGIPAVSGSGIVLTPGATWYESVSSNFYPTNDAVNVISSASGGAYALHERLQDGRLPGW